MAIPIQFILIFGLSEINEVIGSDFDGYVIFVMFQFDVVQLRKEIGVISVKNRLPLLPCC